MTAEAARTPKGATHRPRAIAYGLIVCGSVLAGCGGGYKAAARQHAKHPTVGAAGYQAAVRQHAEHLLGNGNPRIVRIETVRDPGGTKQILATLQGRFKLPPAAGPCGRRCSRTWSGYAWLSFQPDQPREIGGEQWTSAAQIAAIDNAHRARSLFSIFPDIPITPIRCTIPRGNSSRTSPGSCSAHFEGPVDHPSSTVFHEAWSPPTSPPAHSHQRESGGWIVHLDRNEHVKSIHRFGDLLPQFWK